MFGYVIANKQELRLREFDVYRSYYCGLCKTLKQRGGQLGRLALSYDMTFLIMLLTCLYEPETQRGSGRCLVHPLGKHPSRVNEFTEYAADMNLLLSYYQLMDDWRDERKKGRYALALWLKKSCGEVSRRYPEKAEAIKSWISRLDAYEEAGERDVDRLSGCFGHLMGELFAVREDLWEKGLRRMGFYLGKFIYLMDAYEDMEKDEKTGSFNPFLEKRGQEGFDQGIYEILSMMMSECAAEFEKLPIIDADGEILRNILYSGVWTRYEEARKAKGGLRPLGR